MELEGKVWKSKKHWLAEITSLNILTQGHSKEEALEMVKDAVEEYVKYYFESEIDRTFEIFINLYKKGVIGIKTTNNKLLLALSLRRQREKSGSTIRQVSERLGSNSPNAYAQYEKGQNRISLDQYDKLLQAANPHQHSLIKMI